MKKKYLLLIIVGLIIVGLGVFLFLKNNNQDLPIETNNNIIFKANKNVSYNIGYVDDNNYLAIVLKNNDEKNIVSGILTINYGYEQREELINLFPVGGQYLIKTQVPSNLVKDIRNQRVIINFIINEFSNDFSYIDLKKLNKPTTKATINDNVTTIDITGSNNLEKNISCLNGFVLLLNDNKIVGAENFRINDINGKDFSTKVNFNKITKLSPNLYQVTPEFAPIEYNKLQVVYTFAY